MRQRRLFIGAIVVDGLLLLVLLICLGLGAFVTPEEPTLAPPEVELTTVEPTATRTVRPSPTPTTTPTPTQTETPTPIPTMALVTPLPTTAVEEPTKKPYVFPSPIRIEGSAPPTATRLGPR